MRRSSPLASLLVLAALLMATSACNRSSENGDQTPSSVRVGIALFAQHPVIDEIHSGFRERLDSLAAASGIEIEYVERNADGDVAQATSIANVFRGMDVEAVFAVGLPMAQALKTANVGHPIIFGGVPGPIEAGLVPSLTNHGTSLTGTRYFPPVDRIAGLFKEAFPEAQRVAVLHNPGEANSMVVTEAFLEAARGAGLEIRDLGATNATEVEAALGTLGSGGFDGLFIPTDNLVYSMLDRVMAQAEAAGVPVFNCTELSVEKGAVFSLATNYERVGEISAEVAARIILGGEAPSEVDVVDIQEGNLYVREASPFASQIPDAPGYERITVR